MATRWKTIAIAAVASILGGGAASGFYEWRLAVREADAAWNGLVDHYTIAREIEKGEILAATRLATTLADADLMRLMEMDNNRHQSSEYLRKVLTVYRQYRHRNPDLYKVPDYVDAEGRPEYEGNLKRIEDFLDRAANSSK